MTPTYRSAQNERNGVKWHSEAVFSPLRTKFSPGTYINFVSAKKASAALSERGIATIPLSLDWGEELKIFAVTQEEFAKNSLKIFGYLYQRTS